MNTVKTGILCCEMGVNVPRPLGVLFNHAPVLPYHAAWTFPRGLDLQHHGHAPVPHSHVAWVYTTMTARVSPPDLSRPLNSHPQHVDSTTPHKEESRIIGSLKFS